MNTQRLFAIVIVLQVLILASLWLGPSLPVASAQIPDPGAQRKDQLDELRSLNSKVEKLTDLLASGKVQVVVQKADQR